MKISTKGRYALRMMLDLAAHQGDGYVALKDIAQRQEISKKYLEQIVPMLGKSDILRTTRGYQGGYRLARAPKDYTVGEILRLTEGGLAPVACLEQHPNACPRCGECATLPMWEGLEHVIRNYLDGITLQDLLEQQTLLRRDLCVPVGSPAAVPRSRCLTWGALAPKCSAPQHGENRKITLLLNWLFGITRKVDVRILRFP